MKSLKLILILNVYILNLSIGIAHGQQTNAVLSEIEAIKAELLQEASKRRDREEYKPVWQGDFEALHKQVNALMERNARLSIEQRELEIESTRLDEEVKEKELINRDLQKKVGEFRELVDEKTWKEKISDQERQFHDEVKVKNNELQNYDTAIKFLDQKIAVARMKLQLMGVKDNSDQLLALQEERDLVEAKIVIHSEQEKALFDKIAEFKNGNKKLDPAVAALRVENTKLTQEIAELEDKHASKTDKAGFTAKEQVEVLMKQKEQMIEENERLKTRIDHYQKSETMGIDNQTIKGLVESISAVDAANVKLNEEIAYLRENIAILRTRVKKMEYHEEKLKAMKNTNGRMGDGF